MPSPKTPAQTDGRGSAGGGKGGRKRRSRQQPGGTTTTPTTPQTPDLQSQALASPDSRAADQVTEQQLLALKGQQEAALLPGRLWRVVGSGLSLCFACRAQFVLTRAA